MQTAKRFTNFSDEVFTCSWNNEPWTFKAGQSMLLQGYLADHFAKHLIDREMQKKGYPINHAPARNKMVDLCLGGVEVEATSPEKLEAAILNSEDEVKGQPAQEQPKEVVREPKKLDEMNRKELEHEAKVRGIENPEEFKNKDDLKKAIEAVPGVNDPAVESNAEDALEDDFEGLQG